MRKPWINVLTLLLLVFLLGGCSAPKSIEGDTSKTHAVNLENIPEYSGKPYVELNNNQPEFADEDFSETSYEFYSELDTDGKCGVVEANIGTDLMPTEERGNIGPVKPSGWHTVKYDNVDGKYLYNRCHLIGFQLTGENANVRNLITGTRYMNTEGMLPFENLVADYVRDTGNHVMYRVTPIFEGDNLVASGVQMEAQSVEDNGAGICFNVYVYNVQPGIDIDYATGDSRLAGETVEQEPKPEEKITYILNVNTRKFHNPSCSSVSDMKAHNKRDYSGTREDLLADGYEPCGRCRP